jgi:hypothetical protein
MSRISFEHFKTTYQVLLLLLLPPPPPPRFHAGVQRALDRCHCITTVASLRPTSPSTPSSRANQRKAPSRNVFTTHSLEIKMPPSTSKFVKAGCT